LEDKLVHGESEVKEWRSKYEDSQEKLQTEEQARERLEETLIHKDGELVAWEGRHQEAKHRIEELEETFQAETALRQEVEKEHLDLEKTRAALQQTLREYQERYERSREELRDAQIEMQGRLDQAETSSQEWKNKHQALLEQINVLTEEKIFLEQRVNEQIQRISSWSEKYQDLENRFQALQLSHDHQRLLFNEVKKEREDLLGIKSGLEKQLSETQEVLAKLQETSRVERVRLDQKLTEAHLQTERQKHELEEQANKIQTLEKHQIRLLQDLDERSQKLQDWEAKFQELERTFKDLHQSHESLEKMLQVNLKHLEARERELETARRTIRELNAQMEQREMIYRKTQLANQLAEKESKLKEMVKFQQKIETEIRDREESLRKSLTEQESIEREIIEGKQAQRHYIEQQVKKEKSSRIKISRGSQEPPAPTPIEKQSR